MLIVDLPPINCRMLQKYIGRISLTCKSALKMLTLTVTLALDAATVRFLLVERLLRDYHRQM
jgi:hypothetical protein